MKNLLNESLKKIMLSETEDNDPTAFFQSLMDKAYAKWQKDGELAGVAFDDFIEKLPELEEIAVRVGNMNYQVCNGGWLQWWDNQYGPRDLDWLLSFFQKHRQFADSFAWISDLLKKVKILSQKESDCRECDGMGEFEIEEEDPDTGEVEYSIETCNACRGTGIDNDINALYNLPDDNSEDDLDHVYYTRNDELLSDMEKFLTRMSDADLPDYEQEPDKEPTSEEPKAKKKPTVKLVGKDGNAFAILGKVRRAMKDAGYSEEELKAFTDEATSGDYDHLLQTATKWVDVE